MRWRERGRIFPTEVRRKQQMASLWSASDYDFQVIDPRHLPFNKLPPPVKIERVAADGRDLISDGNQTVPVQYPADRNRLCGPQLCNPGTSAVPLSPGRP